MTAPAVRVIEDLDVFTPLGIRFWDAALDRAIDESLRVAARPLRAHPAALPERETIASRTRSGVHVFRWLPGMRAVEHRLPDPTFFDASVPGRSAFVVTVEDLAGRFLPAAFRVDLPLPYHGIFLAEGNDSTPDGSRRGVYLFSAPTRAADERLAVVRGTLADAAGGAPLPWAHVIVRAPHGLTFHGLADEAGRFAVMFPFPPLAEGFEGSPGQFGHGAPIAAGGWDITLEVRSQPSALRALPGTALPEYRSLFHQAAAELWTSLPDPDLSSPSLPPEALLSLRLPFARPLTVRTQSLTVQLTTPAASPP